MKRGAQFVAWGSSWTLVRAERGRSGEPRTMYLIRRADGHEETRSRASVLGAAGKVSK